MTEARSLLERASLRAATLTEEERNAYAVCLKYGFDVPASEVVTILESLAQPSCEGELVAALEPFVTHKPECAVKRFVMSQPPPARHWRCDCGLRAALGESP